MRIASGPSCAVCRHEFEPTGHNLADDVVERIFDNFALVEADVHLGRKIAAGSFGQVFEGTLATFVENRRLETRVAVKMQYVQDEAARTRIVDECVLLSLVSGLPGIIGYYGHFIAPVPRYTISVGPAAGATNPQIGQVMEFATTALVDYMESGHLPPAARVKILHEIANGLVSLHSMVKFDGTPHVVVHEDIKPDNILFDVDDRSIFIPDTVRIADFGLSSTAGVYEVIRGTGGYKDPRQTQAVLGPHIDIFSLGMMVYVMVADASPPFESVQPNDREFNKFIAFAKQADAEVVFRHPNFDPADAKKLFGLMKRCIQESVEARPDACACRAELESILASMNTEYVEDPLDIHADKQLATGYGQSVLDTVRSWCPVMAKLPSTNA